MCYMYTDCFDCNVIEIFSGCKNQCKYNILIAHNIVGLI